MERFVQKLYIFFEYLFFGTTISMTPFYAHSQSINIGTPLVHNYSPKEFRAGTQSWDIEVNEEGKIYIANNNGLLLFDGENWETHTQPNGTLGRSVNISDDKIYIGGQDELGYYSPNETGKLTYQNLLPIIPKERQDLEDIWQIKSVGKTTLFRNRNSINKIENQEYELVASINSNFLSVVDSVFYFNDYTKGIYALNGKLRFVEGSELFKNIAVIDVLKYNKDTLLFLTEQNGLYLYDQKEFKVWNTNADKYLKEWQIISGTRIRNGNIAIGTRLGGLILLDSQGRAISQIDKSTGLQNNSITSVVEDNWGNLWLSSYYGIDKVKMSSSLNYFFPDGQLEGAVYDIKKWEGKWWFGTSNGLYTLPDLDYYNPFKDRDFEFVPNTSGQVWNLDIVDNQLYLGHNNGAFQVNKVGTVVKMGDFIGGWRFVGLSANRMAVGTYDGVVIFKKEAGNWQQDYTVADFSESARVMMKDKEGNLWVSQPYRGVFKIEFNPNIEKYSVKKTYSASSGFQTDNKNYIFELEEMPYVTNDKGIFKYDYENDVFVKDSLLNSLLNNRGRIRNIFVEQNDIWYISDTETGYLKREQDGLDLQYKVNRHTDLSDIYVAGFESMTVLDEQNQMLCTNKGVLYHYPIQQNETPDFRTYIKDVKLASDSIIYISKEEKQIKLNPNENSFEIRFRTNGKTTDEIEGYSYKLEGIDEDWSHFTPQPFKEYTNVGHGKYSFLLKARDVNHLESRISKIEIVVRTPWYLSLGAIVFYVCSVISILAALLFIPRQRYKANTSILENKQKETEKEMEEIRKEKLQNEIRFKTQELASSTLHLLQKNQTLTSVRDKIDEIQKKIQNPEIKDEIRSIESLLRSDLRLDDDWDKFSIHFDTVHQDFIKKLSQQYPKLTTKDHKLCAYLKMNLTTKEIAPLLNISVRGVEISRYRLRKKMALDKTVNLNEFMNSL